MVEIQMQKFGKILNSRPSAKEAVLRVRQIVSGSTEDIVLDFSEVSILTPSFADEFVTGIKEQNKGRKVVFEGVAKNESVERTLKAVNAL